MIAISSVVGKLSDKARELLEKNGCRIITTGEHTDIVTYPEGTQRKEIYPRISEPRYLITFLNGFKLREAAPIGKDYMGLFVDDEQDKAFLKDEASNGQEEKKENKR